MGSNNKESDTHVDAYSDRYRDAGSIPAASIKDILVIYARCNMLPFIAIMCLVF